jgi:hypothetical protein
MKKLSVILLTMFLLTACAPAFAPLLQLPDEGRVLILVIVTAGVTWVLLKLSEVFKIDLSGWANAVAAALAPILITLIESYLQLIPPIFDNLVLSIIHLLVLLVGSLGVFFLAKRRAPSLR